MATEWEDDDWAEVIAPPLVGDLGGVEMCLRKMRRLDRDIAGYNQHATQQRAMITRWLEYRVSRLARERTFLAAAVETFARASTAVTRGKTIALINGTLRLRAPRASVEVIAEDEVADWLHENGHTDKLKMTPRRGELAKFAPGPTWTPIEDTETEWAPMISAEGEVIPGARFVRPRGDTFSMQLAGDDDLAVWADEATHDVVADEPWEATDADAS